MLASATGGRPPAILVLIEVEDASVVADVCAAAGWPEMIDVDVPREQTDGYDVAIAYDPAVFAGHSDTRSFTFDNRFDTRDLLVANLQLPNGGLLIVLATHWASRTMSEAEVLRVGAAIFCSNVLERLLKFSKEDLLGVDGTPALPASDELAARWSTPILVAGDVNDCPWDRSVRALLNSTPDLRVVRRAPRLPTGRTITSVAAYLELRPRLFNPTWGLIGSRADPAGTHWFGGEWSPLDQILVSAGMLQRLGPSLVEGSVRVHAPTTMAASDGTTIRARRNNGTPLAFSVGSGEGVSDHLPLVAELAL
jgi:endonuclease/exonuclease/phosphatase family metal-dependent hydrolase